ncbi:MAG: type I-MYXAN CRISPR-associated protein Cas5/Cmx5/DevS [Pirellulaceae bacterium]|nr:MAG: type I-MYXAN CRISPR-associated protein Cas5/Cmx5/DevS [Pirellulaceae bacterium]
MLAIRVTVPVACFRKGLAREYLETERLPPPATCYGFLLSLVGETDRRRHLGCRICPVLVGEPHTSVVLRRVWRLKQLPLSSKENSRPDYQQLLTSVQLVLWVESKEEIGPDPLLEARIRTALERPEQIDRFGGLSLGESTHLVDEVGFFRAHEGKGDAFLVADDGPLTMPVWVDHVGARDTRYVTGRLECVDLREPPPLERMPRIVAAW